MDPSVGFEIAGLLFKFLGSPILKEIKDIWKYEEDIKMLADTVDIIGDVLNDVEGMSYQESVNKGYKRLREAYLDAQDFLDRVHTLKKKQELMATQIEEAKAEIIKPNGKGKMSFAYVGKKMKPTIDKGRRFLSSSNPAKYAVEVHDAIKEIREKLDAIFQDQKFRLVEPSSSRSEIALTTARATGFYVDAAGIIGRDKDKREIVSLLLKSSVDDRKIPVISIVGIGGMGKTTVAQLVFGDKSWQTICEFDMKLWVSDSKKHDLKGLLKHILKDIDPKDTSLDSLEEDHLKRRLVDEIQGKRFLLVLDDVDNEDPWNWEKLEALLKNGNKGSSRILVTTRSKKVAEVVGSLSDSTYELHGLSDEDSLQLFERYAFQERRAEDLVEIGEQIVQKCSGVPLAVKVIGSYLRGKDKQKWEFVRDNSFADIKDKKNQILPILKLSYDDLDSTVKQCFSYCAVLPRNWLCTRAFLESIWMINVRFGNSGGTLEDVCDKSLRILLDRCFLQGSAEDGKIYTHDLMYDLAKEVAGPDILVVYPNFKVDLNKLIVEENVRHLWLMDKAPIVQLKGKRLRTILLPNDRQSITLSGIASECPALRHLLVYKGGIENISDSIGKLIQLRYLDFRNSEFQNLPNSITELINLRYMNFDHCRNLTNLPSGMGALVSLEALHLIGCRKLEELPRGIEKLMKLRRLLLDGCDALAKMPSGMGALMPVCDPPMFIVGHPESSNHTAQLEELESLSDLVESLMIELPRNITSRVPAWDGRAFLLNNKSLRELAIKWQENPNPKEDVLKSSMDILGKLQPPLNLEFFTLVEYEGMTFPPWAAQHGFASALPNLVSLGIYNCKRCRYLPSMNRLECLKKLAIHDLSSLEYIEENVSAPPFCLPKLEELDLRGLPELKGWCKGDIQLQLLSSFPRLLVLIISACPNLTVPPLLTFAKESDLDSRVEEGLSINLRVHIYDLIVDLSLQMDSSSLSIGNFNARELALFYMAETFRGMLDRPTDIHFTRCSGLKFPPGILQHPGTLRVLMISPCPNFTWKEEEEKEEEKRSVADGIQSTSLDAHTSLKGLSSLQELILQQLPKMVRLPEGIQFLTFLQNLYISNCDSLQKMVRLECLKKLDLCGLSSLEYIEENVSAAPFCLPKLEELVLRRLPELKGWCKGDIQSLLLSSFPRLSVLIISDCPNLTMPPLLTFAKVSDLESRVEEGLSPQVEVHIDGLMLILSLETDSLYLSIRNFNATESALLYMAETFRGMPDRPIDICLSSSGLKTLPGILQHLSTLRRLMISMCPNFMWEEEEEKEEEERSVADGIQSTSLDAHTSLKGLSSLQELILQQLPKMVRLPEGIQFLTSLNDLHIYDCENLLIPEWQHDIFPYKKVNDGGKQIHLAKKEMDGCSSSNSI